MNIRSTLENLNIFTKPAPHMRGWEDILTEEDAEALEPGDIVTVHYPGTTVYAEVVKATRNSYTDTVYVAVKPKAWEGHLETRYQDRIVTHFTLIHYRRMRVQ